MRWFGTSGALGPVDQECNNCPDVTSIYSQANDDNQPMVTLVNLTDHEMVIMIVDHMSRSNCSIEFIT
jgi:hypothetical protein